jgi:hypothetical protein
LVLSPQDAFFKKLPSLLPSVPTLVAQRKLLPMLANAIEFGGAPPVSSVGGKLDCFADAHPARHTRSATIELLC